MEDPIKIRLSVDMLRSILQLRQSEITEIKRIVEQRDSKFPLPMNSRTLLIHLLKVASTTCKNYKIEGQNLDLVMQLYEVLGALNPEKKPQKKSTSVFSEDPNYSLQVLLDQQFINTITDTLYSSGEKVSLREQLFGSKNSTQLTTGTLGQVLHSLIRDYGRESQVDLEVFFSKDKIRALVEDFPMPQLKFTSKGLIKLTLPLTFQIMVLKDGEWEVGRTAAISCSLDIATSFSEPTQTVSFKVKSLAFPIVKVLHGEDELQEDQAMIHTLLNAAAAIALQNGIPPF